MSGIWKNLLVYHRLTFLFVAGMGYANTSGTFRHGKRTERHATIEEANMLRKTGRSVVPWFVGGLACVLTFGLAVPPASASFVFNWSSPGVISHVDTDTNPPGPVPDSAGQNISKVWWGWASNAHYFRMDLAATPTVSDFADRYGIHVDFKSNVGNPLYSGIDTLLTSEFNGSAYTPLLKAWDGHKFATVNDPILSWTGFDFQRSGNTLEWKIFGNATIFNWWGVTEKEGGLMDVSSKVTTTPIPSAAWLFATGVLALVGLKRKSTDNT